MSVRPSLARVLLVDDDPAFIDRARTALDPMTDLRIVRSGRAALSATTYWLPDIIVLDLLLDDLDGFTFLEELHEIELERQPFVLYTIDGRGADTRVRPLPNWRVGTLVRSSPGHQLRIAVMQAMHCMDAEHQRFIMA